MFANVTRIYETLQMYKNNLESLGYTVLYIGLYGSQNYNLDDEQSDIDARAIVLPSFRDLISRSIISKTIQFETGLVDVKDVITYLSIIKKCDASFIEPIETSYYIGDVELRHLFSVYKINLKSIFNTMLHKRKRLLHTKSSDSLYNAKDYHHIIRLYDLLEYIIKRKKLCSFKVYSSKKASNLITIKRNSAFDVDTVKKNADEYIEKAKNLIDKITLEISDIKESIENAEIRDTNVYENILKYLETKFKERL